MSLADEGEDPPRRARRRQRAPSCALTPASGRRASRCIPFYGGAHLFKADTTRGSASWHCAASKPTRRIAATLAAGVGLPATTTLGDGDLAALYERVRAKLQREPIEDFRLDFEDGFGARPDAEEDAAAESSAREVATRAGERPAAAVHRHSHQVVRRRMEERAARARWASSSTRCWRRPAAACPTTSW